jgi:ABC-type glycerol-3-phosphate transport system substrate-binding protein
MAEFLPQYAPKGAGQWGVTTWPSIGGDKNGAGSGGGGTMIVFPKGVPAGNTAAALRYVIDMFMTTRGSLATFHIGSAVPSVTAALNSPSLENNPYFGPDYINAFKAAMKYYAVQKYDPAAFQESTIINNALDTFLASGASDPTSALQTAQSEMQAQIGNPYK